MVNYSENIVVLVGKCLLFGATENKIFFFCAKLEIERLKSSMWKSLMVW